MAQKSPTDYFSTSNDFILNAKQTVVANLTYCYNTAGVYGLDKFSSYSELDPWVRIHLMEKKLQLSLVSPSPLMHWDARLREEALIISHSSLIIILYLCRLMDA